VTITDANATGIDFTSSKNYYSIYGTVTEQGSGDPVAGASLSLYSLGTYLRSTVSDSSGQYMFNGLENGGYTITLDSGCVPEGMGSMSAWINCANEEKNFVCEGGLCESKRQEAASRRDLLKRQQAIDNGSPQADNGDMDAIADKDNPSALSLQPSAQASARIEASVAEYLFYHSDHLGTVRLITDNSGTVVSRHDYEPFGVEIAPYPTGDEDTAKNTHRFTGHERDANTGYDYMHYRSYGSNIGRFMKPDNITGTPLNPQSWNLYSYVRGNPVNFNDPTGHRPTSPKGITYIYDDPDVGDTDTPSFWDRTKSIIPGAHDAEYGDDSYPTILPSVTNVHVNVYIDKEITGKDREEALDNFQSNIMSEVIGAFGSIGIFIDCSFKGEASVSLNNENLPAKVRGPGIATDGSLNVVICDFKGAPGAFAMGKNHTGWILLNRNISPFIAREEFLHAFGICRNKTLDRARVPLYFNWKLDDPLAYYTNPLLIYAMRIMREEASRYGR
jgi:RHS repeat-associated protein